MSMQGIRRLGRIRKKIGKQELSMEGIGRLGRMRKIFGKEED